MPTSVSAPHQQREWLCINTFTQDDRAGILAQAAPNIGPVFFDEIEGADGITRSLQWTARVEASLGINDTSTLLMSLLHYGIPCFADQ
jgi:hypothetical protein